MCPEELRVRAQPLVVGQSDPLTGKSAELLVTLPALVADQQVVPVGDAQPADVERPVVESAESEAVPDIVVTVPVFRVETNDGIDVLSTNAYLAVGLLADAIGPDAYHGRGRRRGDRPPTDGKHPGSRRRCPHVAEWLRRPIGSYPEHLGDTTDQGPTTSQTHRRQQHATTYKQAGSTSG